MEKKRENLQRSHVRDRRLTQLLWQPDERRRVGGWRMKTRLWCCWRLLLGEETWSQSAAVAAATPRRQAPHSNKSAGKIEKESRTVSVQCRLHNAYFVLVCFFVVQWRRPPTHPLRRLRSPDCFSLFTPPRTIEERFSLCAEALFQSFLITLTYLMTTKKRRFPFPLLVFFSTFCFVPNANTAAVAAVEKRIKLNADA